MKVKDLLKGKSAKYMLEYLLKNYEYKYLEHKVAGYYKENGAYVCFDNTNNDCYVENTDNLHLARMWCLAKIEVRDLYLLDN